VNDAKRSIKQKAFEGMMEYLLISFYLGVVLSLFTVYKVVILAEHNIDFAPHGFAIINALALAKIILVAQELHFAEQPQKTFAAKTVRTSNALNPTLRTLQVELELDNAKHEVFPGAYAEVHFKLPANAESLRLPANTVLFRAAGLQVATVDNQKHVKLKSIVQGRDFGNTIEILSGLESTDVVVLNPPDSLTDGEQVRIVKPGGGKPEDTHP